VKQFLLVRATGRIEGNVTCGDVQVEKGAILAGGVFSVHASGKEGEVKKEQHSPVMTLAAAE
jgi:cytoskeletal protein CcmA (bactofilin family)